MKKIVTKWISLCMAAVMMTGAAVCVNAAEDEKVGSYSPADRVTMMVDVNEETAAQLVQMIKDSDGDTVEVYSQSATILTWEVLKTMLSEQKNLNILICNDRGDIECKMRFSYESVKRDYEKWKQHQWYKCSNIAIGLEKDVWNRQFTSVMLDGAEKEFTSILVWQPNQHGLSSVIYGWPEGAVLDLYVGDMYEDGTRLFMYYNLDFLPDEVRNPKNTVPKEVSSECVSEELVPLEFVNGWEGMKGYVVTDGYVSLPVEHFPFELRPICYSRALLADENKDFPDNHALLLESIFARGDADLSGSVELTDVQMILRDYLDIEKLSGKKQQFAADYNGDGDIDLWDAQAALASILDEDQRDCEHINESVVAAGTMNISDFGTAMLQKSDSQETTESAVCLYTEEELFSYIDSLDNEDEKTFLKKYQLYFQNTSPHEFSVLGGIPYALAVVRKTVPTDSLGNLDYCLFCDKSMALSERWPGIYRLAFEYAVKEGTSVDENYELFVVAPLQISENVITYFFNE